MKKLVFLSITFVLILLGFMLLNSIKIPAPTKENEFNFSIDQFT